MFVTMKFIIVVLVSVAVVQNSAMATSMFMLKSDTSGFNVTVQGTLILQHTRNNPMLFLGGGTTTFVEHHGNFDINDYIDFRIPLADFIIKPGQQSGSKVVTLTASSEQVTISMSSDDVHPLIVKFENISGNADRIWLRLPAEKNEYVYGGGEQFSYFNLRGHTFPIWTREQGVGRNKSTIVTAAADLESGAGGDYHTTYYPEPTFFSSRHYYCHVDIDNYAIMDFSHSEFHELAMWGKPAAIYYNWGDSVLNLTQKFSDFMGRQPELPDWIMEGTILGVQGGTDKMLDYLKQARDHGIVVRGLWIQDWVGSITTSFGKRLFWDWTWNEQVYPNLDKVIAQLKTEGVRILAYINPNLNTKGKLYKEADANGYMVKNSTGQTYINDFGEFYCGTVDMTNPGAFEWYKNVIKTNMLDLGLSGWMADFGEYLPVDGVFHNGQSGQEVHNLWPMLWARLNRETVEEAGKLKDAVYWMRAGYSGTQNYSVLMWAGDQNVDFSYADGVASTIPAALSLGVQGNGLTHFDIGGYTSLFAMVRSKQLLMRSAEHAVFTPVMRTHEGNRPKDNWQYYTDANTLNEFARLTKLHNLLFNYTKAVVKENADSGIPAQRPLFFHYDETPDSLEIKYEYLYGRDLLVAPVFLVNHTQWSVYLPQDDWVYLWNSTDFKGPGRFIVNSPVGQPPVFYRKASLWKSTFEQLKDVKLVPVVTNHSAFLLGTDFWMFVILSIFTGILYF